MPVCFLEQGGDKVFVLEYFDDCEAFWIRSPGGLQETIEGKLAEWRRGISSGQVPDFGTFENY